MKIAQLTPQLSASPQILPGDLGAIAAQGFKTLICNRPDGEGADQPTHEELATAAATLGMRLHYLPVVSGKVEDASATRFGALLSASPGPVLAYCRTGMRATTLWALSSAPTTPAAELIAAARQAGYDLSALALRLAAPAAAANGSERTDA
jgi:sulfide:quinone oxidoreductase